MSLSTRPSAWLLLVFAVLVAAPAEAVIRNNNTGVTYATIQQAIDAAAVGHVILVDAGTYNESLTITKSLTIQRNGAGTAIIDPVSGNGVTISGASVTLRDLRVTGAPGNGVSASGGPSHALTLERVEIVSNGVHGFEATNYLVVTIAQGSYSNNGVHGAVCTSCGTVQMTGATVNANTNFGVVATGISNALNLATSSLTNNAQGPLFAENPTRAGGVNLDRVLMTTGSSTVRRFTAVTVWVTGIDETTNDQLHVTQQGFSTTRNGVVNHDVNYSDLGSVTFNMYGGNDSITIFGAGSPVVVSAGDGNDTMTVGNNGNSLDDLGAALSLFGGPGTDTVTLRDQGDTQANAWSFLADQISRAPATINYNSTVETIQVNGGSGNDTFAIGATTTRINIHGGDGNDLFDFGNGATLSGGTIVGGGGTDTLDYNDYATSVRVSLSTDVLLQAALSQANEVPPSGSPGNGGVLMVYNPVLGNFDMRVGLNGIAPASITAMHIHSAAAGVNGPIIVNLDPLAPWQTVGASAIKIITAATFPPASLTALNAGNTYVNVHTSTYAAGAVRGQLAIVVPANSATGTGGVSEVEQVTGGSANDLLVGSDADNTLRGQAGNDALFGRGGSDRFHGEDGDDLMFGDGADDVAFWNGNGGNDTFEGGAGTDFFHMVGHPTLNDAMTAFPNGGRMVAARTNLTPYANDLGNVDYISLQGHGGDDFFTLGPPLPGVFLNVHGDDTGSSGDTLRYNAGCAGAREEGSIIRHPTMGLVGRLSLETTIFENRIAITPELASFASAGGNGMLSVTVSPGASCSWTAAASMPFIQITGGASGSGNGTVSYRVTPNLLTTHRHGLITIAGWIVDIFQGAAGMAPTSPFDLNGDGVGDLLLHHSTDGSIAGWFMNERVLIDGSILGHVPDLQWQVAGMGDFNSDGKIDILWQRMDDARLAVWLMNGTERLDVQFLAPDRLPEPAWKVRAVGDMNSDGKPDLIIQHADGRVGVWFMNGLNQLDGRLFVPDNSGVDWTIVGAADLNADGKRDLVFQRNDGALAAWYMDGATRLDAVLFTPAMMGDPTWRIKGIMDVNVDGHPDLLMQHPDGRMAAFLLNGVTLVDGILFVPDRTMDPAWRLVGPR